MDSQILIGGFVVDDGLKDVLPELELTRQRMFLLKEPERLFLEQYLIHGLSIRKMEAVIGLDRRVIARKIERLVSILIDQKYIRIYARRHRLPERVSDVAYDYLVLAMGYRALAIKYKMPQYSIRKIIKRINKLAAIRASNWQGKVI